MVLLIDANVVLDYLLEREPQYYDAERLMECFHTSNLKGYVAFHSVSIIWYNLRKISSEDRRKFLLNVTDMLTVASASHDEVVSAINNENFPDFEDCLQEKCALNVGADFIVTNNVKDFKSSKVPALTPTEILEVVLHGKSLHAATGRF